MIASAEFNRAFEHARQLHAQGRLPEAEQVLKQLASSGDHREAALRALVELYRHSSRLRDAIDTLVSLTEEVPDELYYYARLAALLEGCGQSDQAIGHYRRLLQRRPELAEAHYNLALLYRKNRRYPEAMDSYQQAVKFGISDVEEVYSNMGVLYSELRQKEMARRMYERALAARPGHIPALFNLGGLLEEAGEQGRAVEYYEQILSLEPRHWEALARLAHARRQTDADSSLIDSLRGALSEAGDDRQAMEGLYFALGKAMDDLGRYEEAFVAYRAANKLGSQRTPPYDRQMVERAFDQLIELFSRDWLRRSVTSSTARPIFICGMFRSGSTLIEQVLASHPAVTSAGELDCLPWLVEQKLKPFPQGVIGATRGQLEEVGNQYISELKSLFPEADRITDKRPDNFLLLGLIKAVFPSARVIYTKRNLLDNCLSVYFQQLGDNLNYATEIENIAHYYRQHDRLMGHWIDCFGENIFTVDYDEFVGNPAPMAGRLLEFLGLPWDDRCLAFQRMDNLVKTASVSQVREELHSQSSGRWRNYAPFLADVLRGLDGSGV